MYNESDEKIRILFELTVLNKNNFYVFQSLKDELKKRIIVPFIGAGTTVDIKDENDQSIYPLWEDYLKYVENKFYILSEEKKFEFDNLVENKKYYEAADILIEDNYNSFYDQVSKIYGKHPPETSLKKSLIMHIAKIFNNSISITVNFDRAVEQAFNLNQVQSYSLLSEYNKIVKENRNGIHKYVVYLHGKSNESTNDIHPIFSKKDVEKYYVKDGDVYNFIKNNLNNYKLLFIGVGLNDEYVSLIKNSLEGLECSNYAILENKNFDLQEKTNSLKKNYVDTIFYPYKEHTYVRKILDLLIDEKFNCTSDDIRDFAKHNSPPFQFENLQYNLIDYIDLENNISKLKNFLDIDDFFSYITIKGEKYSGKTRLSLELQKIADEKKYDVYFYNKASITNIFLKKFEKKFVVIIFDEYDCYKDNVKERLLKFIDNLKIECDKRIKQKVRLVFVLNEGTIKKTDFTKENIFKSISSTNIEDLNIVLSNKNIKNLSYKILEAGIEYLSDKLLPTNPLTKNEIDPMINRVIEDLQSLESDYFNLKIITSLIGVLTMNFNNFQEVDIRSTIKQILSVSDIGFISEALISKFTEIFTRLNNFIKEKISRDVMSVGMRDFVIEDTDKFSLEKITEL